MQASTLSHPTCSGLCALGANSARNSSHLHAFNNHRHGRPPPVYASPKFQLNTPNSHSAGLPEYLEREFRLKAREEHEYQCKLELDSKQEHSTGELLRVYQLVILNTSTAGQPAQYQWLNVSLLSARMCELPLDSTSSFGGGERGRKNGCKIYVSRKER